MSESDDSKNTKSAKPEAEKAEAQVKTKPTFKFEDLDSPLDSNLNLDDKWLIAGSAGKSSASTGSATSSGTSS